MLVLLDNGAPRGLARFLAGHSVQEARSRGSAEPRGSKIALVVLDHSQWPMVKLVAEKIAAAVNSAQPGTYVIVEAPFKDA